MHALGPSFQSPQVSWFWFQEDFDPLRDDPCFQDLCNEEPSGLEALEVEWVAVLDEKGAG